MARKINDQMIADLVGSVERPVPNHTDARLKRRLQKERLKAGGKKSRSYLWLPVPAFTALLLLLFFILPLVNNQEVKEGSDIQEIKTEFFIKDKNIKIMWFSKKDFNLRRKK
jgi:hypothetical protein